MATQRDEIRTRLARSPGQQTLCGTLRGWATRLRVIAAIFSLAGAGAANASDGLLEINHTCALVGCFAGDAAGYPVTLANDGSYQLTSNLEPAGADGIEIATTSVNVDLNGFAILGPGDCDGTTGATVSCLDNAGTGINAALGIGDSVAAVVHHGTIRGMSTGINFFSVTEATLADLTIIESGSIGISLGSGRVERVTIKRTGSDGISIFGLGSEYVVAECDISVNGGSGISAGGGTGLVRDSIFLDNGGWGVLSEFLGSPTLQPALAGNNLTGNDLGQARGGTAISTNLCSPASGCP